MIDFHCHLDLYEDPTAILRECVTKGMYVLAVTTTPTAWTGTSALVGRAERIRVALGLHPQLARERKVDLDLFDRLLPEARCVGEVGLDGSPEFRDQWHDQLAVFEHVLSSCCAAGGRIMSIHSRRAVSAVLERVETHRAAGVPVLHWYSGSFKDLERAVAVGCWFSVGPAMASSEKGQALIARMPPDQVLTETDGPFAALGDRRLVPWDVNIAVPRLAELWHVSRDSVEARLRANLRNLLRETPSVENPVRPRPQSGNAARLAEEIMFKTLMNDRVTLVKRSGQRYENLHAAVQSKLILTENVGVPIEDGDVFERTQPSGIVEAFEIVDAGFHQAFHGMPAHYQSKVEKRSARPRPSSSPQVVYNLIGANARVNIASNDSSTNVVNVESNVLFQNLRNAVEASIPDRDLNRKLVHQVDEMEAAAGTSGFAAKYKDFIGLAADHVSVFGPFLPALTQFLT